MEIESFLRSSVAAPQPAAPSAATETGNAPAPKAEARAEEPSSSSAATDEGNDATGAEESGSPAATKDATQGKENAFLGERRRRQAAEKEAIALKTQLETLRQQQNGPQKQDNEPKKEPGFWDDPEAYSQRHRDEVRRETAMLRYEMSEQTARAAHQDFDEFRDEFLVLAESNPVFVEQMRANKHPAEFAYQHGKRFRQAREIGELGDLDSYKEKLRQEIRDELSKELEVEKPLKAAEKVPESLATKRGAGGVKRQPYQPKTLEETFDKSRFARARR